MGRPFRDYSRYGGSILMVASVTLQFRNGLLTAVS